MSVMKKGKTSIFLSKLEQICSMRINDFIIGAGRIFDVTSSYNYRQKKYTNFLNDFDALNSDWNAVKKDISVAMAMDLSSVIHELCRDMKTDWNAIKKDNSVARSNYLDQLCADIEANKADIFSALSENYAEKASKESR